MVLSDGWPSANGNGYNKEADERKLHKSIKEAEAMGVETIGIGILDSSVSKFYKKHVVVNNITDLMGTALQQLKGILLKGTR
jgi:cobalamin biosynthesis protein CobT